MIVPTPTKLSSSLDNQAKLTSQPQQSQTVEQPQKLQPNKSTSGAENVKEHREAQPEQIVQTPHASAPNTRVSPRGSPDEIPQSMVDIYKLSNKTRRNKKKKLKKEGKTLSASDENDGSENRSSGSSPVSPLLMKADGSGTVVSVAIGDSPIKKTQQQLQQQSQLQLQQQQRSNAQPPTQPKPQQKPQTQLQQHTQLQQKPQSQNKPQITQKNQDKVVIDLDPDADSDTNSTVDFMKSIGECKLTMKFFQKYNNHSNNNSHNSSHNNQNNTLNSIRAKILTKILINIILTNITLRTHNIKAVDVVITTEVAFVVEAEEEVDEGEVYQVEII